MQITHYNHLNKSLESDKCDNLSWRERLKSGLELRKGSCNSSTDLLRLDEGQVPDDPVTGLPDHEALQVLQHYR